MAAADLELNEFITTSATIASFTFSELTSGLGFITFYGASTSDSSGNEFILSEQVFDSQDPSISGNGGINGNFVLAIDQDYDSSLFNLARTLNGDVLLTCSVGGHINGSHTSGTASVFIKVFVRKWDGSSETPISDNTSGTLTEDVPSSTNFKFNKTFAIKIRVSDALIPEGEQLRITVNVSGKWSGSNATNFHLAQDPSNRNAEDSGLFPDTVTKQLIINVPSKTDL